MHLKRVEWEIIATNRIMFAVEMKRSLVSSSSTVHDVQENCQRQNKQLFVGCEIGAAQTHKLYGLETGMRKENPDINQIREYAYMHSKRKRFGMRTIWFSMC